MNVKFSPHSISTNSIVKKIPLIVGYYYVVDAGFPLILKAFLPPYKGYQYHLSRFSDVEGTPHGNNELFNYNHLSLRNVIERCFGMLYNESFPYAGKSADILTDTTTVCGDIILYLHNFCRIHQPRDVVYRGLCLNEQIVRRSNNFRHDLTNLDVYTEGARQMGREQDAMAQMMWNVVG